ncbi:uncharacterized protein K452DRAFT_351202 [Aplosporella prunicola CBS 121167]|uniref:Methyltransferase domain-containing protein n=1 Tax=Aplosporella prunicola CBS 121167 TaxID=1176127 RepID=A0A6A6BEB8_9PEZI|nr:uncharacterized protein K452DRAFT_351202 [Aplosporella prunicola CBS 121167]KAF2141645.1 hypothetical protein K452DRAFT_351202 [Aplosporella prunicola CBS 121167]
MSNQKVNNNRFNAEAAAWDSNPGHVYSSELATKAVLKYTLKAQRDSKSDLDVLEIGCGTGLMSFMLAPHVHSLMGVDTAEGMVDAFRVKLSEGRDKNLAVVTHFLETPDAPEIQNSATKLLSRVDNSEVETPVRWDLIISHLTLHHIPSLPDILRTMYASLKPGGQIALTDFEDTGPEAVLFHPVEKREGVERHGIKRNEMEMLIREAGFEDAAVEVAFTISKAVDEKEANGKVTLDFPFVVCLGRKPLQDEYR